VPYPFSNLHLLLGSPSFLRIERKIFLSEVDYIVALLIVTVDSHGGGLITVTGPCPGGLDTETRFVTQWQDRWLARDWLVPRSPWNRDEDYDTVVKSEKGNYDVVG
jgi:hypothetical protein